jgi:molybdate transport repressor ModE-like protein
MYKVSIQPQWHLEQADGRQSLPRLVELLARVRDAGTLAEACVQAGLSYRYAWGLLQEGATTFGAPLVKMSRGRGAVLTPLAEKLVWADKRITARLAPMLDSLASELEVELERALCDSGAILRVQASHGFAVETLRDWFTRSLVPIDLKYRSSFEALTTLRVGGCDLAGFHVPLGEFQSDALQQYARWLLPTAQQRLIVLATRRQGLMVAPGNPKNLSSLSDLTHEGVRFVNRQAGSGTRLLLDLLLKKQGVNGPDISGFDSSEFTHAAVAAYVASGMADAGVGVEAAAKRFDLGFIPLVNERYFFLCSRDKLKTPALKRVIETLNNPDFRNLVNALPGYDATDCGSVLTVDEAFPEFKALSRSKALRGERLKK